MFGSWTKPTGFTVVAIVLLTLLVPTSPVLAEEVSADAGSSGDTVLSEEFETELQEESAGFPDPLEKLNRGVFRFNQGVDDWVFEPVARVYGFVIPDPAKRAVRRFFDNLNSPAVVVNDLLQCEGRDAGITTARFALNTTVGVGGLFDPASALDLEGHYSDFGQTLALVGVGSGPYLIIPIFGPTTLRDTVGTLVGVLLRPTTYLLGPTDQLYYSSIYGGSVGVVVREENAKAIRVLKDSSIDYYAALRSAYYQVRTVEIWHRRQQQQPQGADESIPTELAVH